MKKVFLLFVSLLALFAVRAQDVTYLDASGAQQTLSSGNYTVVTDQTAWTSGWYVVNADVTIDSRITATGDVHLVLKDGVTFNAKKGITVNYNSSANNALTIYAQSTATGMGKLVINSVIDNNAGIGASKSSSSNGNHCGVITINGGDLDIKSGNSGAAIGSASNNSDYSTNNGVVIVNGGSLTLRYNGYGAGIGGGEYTAGGTIIINGGTINATGGSNSAAIGGCDGSDGGNITITGGVINATGNNGSPGIGGGSYWSSTANKGGQSGTITITGGQISSYSGYNGAAAIGAATSPKPATASDVIHLSWTNSTDRYCTYAGGYKAGRVIIEKPFDIESTGELATQDDLHSASVLVPHEGETLHSVTYIIDGEVYQRVYLVEGQRAENLPYKPSDNLFDAWYEDGDSEPWNFEVPVMQDLVLVAHFKNVTLNTDGSGSYLIGTAEEWNAFAVKVYNGETTANAKLTGDITEVVDFYMVGSSENKYAGTFDGQGYTLTVGYETTESYIAPFRYVAGATIKNLKVAGTVTPRSTSWGGFVAASYGVTITDCVSSVTFDSKYSGSAYIGGFVSFAFEGTNRLTNCVFDGKLLNSATSGCTGFVYNASYGKPITLDHCYFVPEEITIQQSNGKAFTYRDDTTTFTDCYYATPLGTPQKGTFMAKMIPGEGVTLNGTPTLTNKGVDYYADGSTIGLNYDLPEGKFFTHYTVSSGSISNEFEMTGDHVVSGFTSDVTIEGGYVDSKIDIALGSIAAIADETYNKAAHEPELQITMGDEVLEKNKDYLVQWSNNVEAGIATATVNGYGLYGGQLTAQFNILQRNINDEVIATSYLRRFKPTGEVIHPVPTLTYDDYTLLAGTDYEVNYSAGCIEPGDYSIIITGKGNYTGVLELPFSIIGAVSYLDYADGSFTESSCDTYTLLNDQTTLTDGWYVVGSDVTIPSRITATGDVHIILMDDACLHAQQGINVNYLSGTNNKLSIYAQSNGDGMGKLLIDKVNSTYAGIGGGSNKSSGIITINGGDLDIKSGSDGAAIGSGSTVRGDNRSVVIINGGTLMLRSNSYGAGIGGGEYSAGGTITINGGNITAIGGTFSAAIGGCDGYDGGIITINGGIINATGTGKSPGIGGGGYWGSYSPGGQSGTITINGGQITATPASECTTAIGAAAYASSAGSNDKITLSWTNEDDFIIANGNYTSGSVTFKKPFKVQATGELAMLDNIANATIVPFIGIEDYTLAEALGLDDNESAKISDALIVVAKLNNSLYATDGLGNWIRADVNSADGIEAGMTLTDVMGTFANMALAPTIQVSGFTAEGGAGDVSQYIAQVDLAHGFDMPSASQVVKFGGYFFNGKLRGFANNMGQSLTLDGDLSNFMEGKRYFVLVGIELNEIWQPVPNGAPRSIRANDYDYDFQNLVGRVVSAEEDTIITGIHDLAIDGDVESVKYVNTAGQMSDKPFNGVNIVVVRLTDGNTKTLKVVF